MRNRVVREINTSHKELVSDHVSSLISAVNSNHQRPLIPLWTGHGQVNALFDTGATINILRADTYAACKAAGLVTAHDPSFNPNGLTTAGGDPLPVMAKIYLRTRIRGVPYNGPFLVCKKLSNPAIIGMRAIGPLGIAYHPTSGQFSFAPAPAQDDHAACLTLTKDVTVPPLATVWATASPSGQKWTHTDLVASVLGADVMTTTDEDGKCDIPIFNPTDAVITLPRRHPLGAASLLAQHEVEAADQPEIIASIAQAAAAGREEDSQPRRHDNAPPPLTDALRRMVHQAAAHLPKDQKDTLVAILSKHREAISRDKYDLGHTDLHQHSIDLKDKSPVFHKQFPIPLQHKGIIDEQMQQWLKLGVIEPAKSPYNSPIFCVRKKGGAGYRLCLDYRALNSKSLPENYCIRTAEDCMAEVGQNGGRYFIALDLSSGFYQMPLMPSSRPCTAFTVPKYGQMQWTRAAMGLKGCPASFQRLMDMATKGLDGVITYIDDVLVYGRTPQEAMDRLAKVLARFAKHHLKVNLTKSTFLQPETHYLGHILSKHGIAPGTDKRKAVAEAKPPNSVKALRAFLGMVNYFRAYIRGYAKIAGRLYALTRAGSPWRSGPLPAAAQQAFDDLRKAVASAVPRAFPTCDGKFHLYVDGSQGDDKDEGGLGAYLAQEQQGRIVPIGFASRQLRRHEKNYSAFLLELQAAAFGIDHFTHYLRGRNFCLYTDHAPLTSLSTVHKRTLHRLHDLLNEHHFEIKHIPGKENAVADFLSRNNGAKEEAAALEPSPSFSLLQQQDPTLRAIIHSLQQKRPLDNLPPMWKPHKHHLLLSGGILSVRLPPRPGYFADNRLRAVVPQSLAASFIAKAHNSAAGGHQGIFRTEERIREKFYWPGMNAQIAQHVSQCLTCQATSNKDAPRHQPRQPIPPETAPNERIHMDFFGPITGENGDHKYILGVTDAFTKVVRLAAIPNKEATTVAEAIIKRVGRNLRRAKSHSHGQRPGIQEQAGECALVHLGRRAPHHGTLPPSLQPCAREAEQSTRALLQVHPQRRGSFLRGVGKVPAHAAALHQHGGQ